MDFHIMTLFPDMVRDGLNTSILARAAQRELISIKTYNIRDYTLDKHKKVDDYTYGGGAGMLMQAQPVYDCYAAIVAAQRTRQRIRTIYVTPQGKTFHQGVCERGSAYFFVRSL